MISLKEYLLETLIYITEAKLPEFVNKYMKAHANHSIVKSNPDKARELIAAAHPFAGDHDEAMFLTKHLLDRFYIPGEDEATMSMVTKTWRSAKAKGYISSEERLAGASHDDVIARFDQIPELANAPKAVTGKVRKALSILKPHKIGTIDHREHGKLDVYHFDKDNSSDEGDRELKRKQISSLCSEGRYSWCVLPATNAVHFQTYSQKGSGFFLYIDEKGVSRLAHGHGDRATPNVPGGVVVGPLNNAIDNQKEVKQATMELLPPGKREAYGVANNIVPETNVKEFLSTAFKHIENSNKPEDILNIGSDFVPHLDEDLLTKMHTAARKHSALQAWDVYRRVNATRPLKMHILNSIINNSNPPREDHSILRMIDLADTSDDNEIKNAFLQLSKHESPAVRRSVAALNRPTAGDKIDWLDSIHTQLMNDPDPNVRHNALIGHHMTEEKGNKFIFEEDNPLEDKLKAFFSRAFSPGYDYSGRGVGRGNKLLVGRLDNILKPEHNEFLTQALKIDAITPARGSELHFNSDALKEIYHRTTPNNIPLLRELAGHPNLPSDIHNQIMDSTQDELTTINGLKSPVASKEIIEKHGTHENPNVRLAAFMSPTADLEFAIEGIHKDSDPKIKGQLFPFVKNVIKNLKTYIAPSRRYDSSGNPIFPSEQHLRNRRYILNTNQDELLNPFYDTVADDDIDINEREKLLIPADKILSHMRNSNLSGSTHYGITKYLRRNLDNYEFKKTNPELHKEIEDYIARPDGAWSVPKANTSSPVTVTAQMPFTEQKTFSKKIIRESIISNIQNYFNKL